MRIKIITNNKKVYDYYKDKVREILFIQGGYRDVLCSVRDETHRGSVLVTHPLSGSIKPNETWFKSIAISPKENYEVDLSSLSLIENSIETYDKFHADNCKFDKSVYREEILDDYRTVDFSLLYNSLNQRGGYTE